MGNFLRTAVLLAALTALFGAVGYLLGGGGGMAIALGLAVVTNAFAYWSSDRLALAAHGAVEVDDRSAPELVGLVRGLADRAGLPMPRVYLIEADQPNAFATGRDPAHAAVAVTRGLIATLSRQELAGVIAHELAHVRNRDTLTMTIAATIAGAISSIAQFGFLFGGRNNERTNPLIGLAMMILAPLAAMIIQMAISRSREYAADRAGAEICGDPLWLASALAKIAGYARQIPNPEAERHPATAPMFIINPLSGHGLDTLFSTHPSTESRIAALEDLAREHGRSIGAAPARASVPTGRGGPFGRPRRGPWG